MDRTLTVSVQPLVELAAKLGLQVGDLVGVERPARLAGKFQVQAAAVAQLQAADLEAVVTEYGDAVHLDVRTDELTELTVHGRFDPDELTALLADAAKATTYDLVIEIDKSALVQRIVPDRGTATTRLFFFADALCAAFRHGPRTIEETLWEDIATRLAVIVLDRDLRISGACISVVGGNHIDQAPDEISRPPKSGLERVATRRNDYVGWDSEIATTLTPQHFVVEDAVDAGPVGECLNALVATTTALYLCDRARLVTRPGEPPYIQAEFRGREHVAYIPIRWTDRVPGLDDHHVTALSDIIGWCYELAPERDDSDMVGDRLPFVQIRVAQLLEGRPEADRLAALAAAMPAIGEGVKWHWRAFIDGRVTDYLDQVRDLEGVVGDLITKLSDQTSLLVKRVSESALAAIAALIGSLIAAAFKDPFQADLFRIGMLTYAAYVVIFPLGFGVTSAWSEAKLIEESYDTQCKHLEPVLGADRVTALVNGRDSRATRRFRHWAVAVIVIYLVAALAACALAFGVPPAVTATTESMTTPAPGKSPGQSTPPPTK